MMLALLPFVATSGHAAGDEPRSERALRLSLQTDRAVYRTGQAVRFQLTLSNDSTKAIPLRCNDAQRFDLLVQDTSGKSVWRWSEDQMFAQMQSEETIQPGKSLVYTAVFTGTLSPAEYRASGVILCLEPPVSAHAAFTVH